MPVMRGGVVVRITRLVLPIAGACCRLRRSAYGPAPARYAYVRAGDGRGEQPAPAMNTEAYDRIVDNPPSTFSIDVDTAPDANVRRFLEAAQALAASQRGE